MPRKLVSSSTLPESVSANFDDAAPLPRARGAREHERQRFDSSSFPAMLAARIFGASSSNESSMMLPTSSTLSAATPSRARCSLPSCDGVQSTSEIASVTIRLISSGIVRSPLRKPASRCATGISSFAPTSAQASVEILSPFSGSNRAGLGPADSGSQIAD